MLATSTAHAILQTRFYLIQFPTLLDPKATPALLSQLSKYDIAASWMSRLNVSFGMRSNIYFDLKMFLDL